jgi:hypothetical protein
MSGSMMQNIPPDHIRVGERSSPSRTTHHGAFGALFGRQCDQPVTPRCYIVNLIIGPPAVIARAEQTWLALGGTLVTRLT